MKTNATTEEGMKIVADQYDVQDHWQNYLADNGDKHTQREKYDNLLMIVKTKSKSDNIWVSFIEGLHRHTAILFCMMCSYFNCHNVIKLGSLSMKHFKQAAIPHFQKNLQKPKDHLEDILQGNFQADMLMKPFRVQVFYPIDTDEAPPDLNKVTKSLQTYSRWIYESKISSASKTLPKLLSTAILEVMNYSKKHPKLQPKPKHVFTYQKDQTVQAYHTFLVQNKTDRSYGYSTILSSEVWKKYIANPFDETATQKYLQETTLECKDNSGTKLNPPFVITFENITKDVGLVKEGKRLLDVRHYNAYLLIPRLVYHISTKLKHTSLNMRLGRKYEMDLIHYLSRFGYGTRAGPYAKLHGAIGCYTDIKGVMYINNCDKDDRILPVTLFLVMLFNACMTYSSRHADILIDALDRFDINTTLDDNTFMSTMSKCLSCNILFQNRIIWIRFFK